MLTYDLSSDYLEDLGIKFAEVKTIDVDGRMKSRTFPVSGFDDILKKGFRVDASSIGYAETEKSDAEIRLLEKPNLLLPQYRTSIFLGELYDDSKPVPTFGRNILKGVLEKIPYEVKFGAELECYLTTRDMKTLDNAGYMASEPDDTSEDFKKNFMILTEEADTGLGIKVGHAEVGPSQHEFEITLGDPVDVMDRMLMIKYLLKLCAKYEGIRATTMPKPYYEEAGSGFHLHVSFWKDGENIFYGDEREISDSAKYAISGVLRHSTENAVLTNSTVNSYKRLVPNHEAPVCPVWGPENRTAMVRIPKPKELTKDNSRIEVRNPDFACDPYLSAAAVIRAAFMGLEKNYEKLEPCSINADTISDNQILDMGLRPLPRSLDEAIEKASSGDTIIKSIHPEYEKFIKRKRAESLEYKAWLRKTRKKDTKRTTEWELEKYFNI